MNKETLRALKGSIKKWEKIAMGKGLDLDGENCPLCKACTCPDYGGRAECPVYLKSKRSQCRGTPWETWNIHQIDAHQDKKTKRVFKSCSTCKRLAQAELDFLKSLLSKATP